MKEDIIDIEITEDGQIKSTTPKISAANHSNSHQFFNFLARLTGGAMSFAKRDKHAHTHQSEGEQIKGGN